MSQQKVKTIINGVEIEVTRDRWAIDVIREQGISVPTLCHHPALEPYGSCRLCVVEVTKGQWTWLTTCCDLPIREGLRIDTESEAVRASRKLTLELLWARAPESETITALARDMGIETRRFSVADDLDRCILCGLCVRVCDQVMRVSALGFSQRGNHRKVVTPFDICSQSCVGCQACVAVCPTGHIKTLVSDDAWHLDPLKTELEMVSCDMCHKPYMPQKYLACVASKWPDKVPIQRCCPACVRQTVVEKHQRAQASSI